MGFDVGDRVGNYKIVAAVGSGGMGEVFQVEHAVTHRIEAMKILAAEAAGTPEQSQRFLREIQLHARLNHPHIAAVHNAFWESGHLVMVMELIQGNSLRTLLDKGKPRLWTSVDYACQALAALDYAHGLGVVHRDISPANMIITDDGTLKLTDFGLAKSTRDLRITETGTLLGSLYYISPEQVHGHDNVDARSDIYSLGAVLYEMVTGVRPFDADSPFTLMLAHVEQAPPPPTAVSSGLPLVLEEILLKALDKDPAKRFQSAELFRWALENVKDVCDERRCRRTGLDQAYAGNRLAAFEIARSFPAETGEHAAPGIGVPAAAKEGLWRAWWRSPWTRAAAASALVFAIPYVWKGRLSTGSDISPVPVTETRTATIPPPPDFDGLPFTWPRDLIRVPKITYMPKKYLRRWRASSDNSGAENPKAGSEQAGANRTPFLRAMGRTAQPNHHSEPVHPTATVTVTEEP